MSKFRKLAVQYSHFFTGNLLVMMLGFVSFPVLTRVLSREEYGVVGLVTTTMLIAVAFAKAGLSDGIIRYYKSYSSSDEQKSVFASTVIVRGLILALLALLVYILTIPLALKTLGVNPAYTACFIIMSAYLFVRPLNIIVLNMLRACEKTIFYNVSNIVTRAAAIGISLLLLLAVLKNFYGYFFGIAFTEFAFGIALYYWFFKNYRVRLSAVSGQLAKQLMKFGIPLLFTEISYLLLSYADRYMIQAYRGEGDLGLYSVGYNLASYLSDIMMFSLSYAVIPIYVGIYHKEGREETERFLSKCFNYLMMAVVPVFFIYSTVTRDLLVALASAKYEQAALFSPVILLGSFFMGVNNIFNAGLYLKSRSAIILGIMFAALVLNIALNAVLLPQYGISGAAFATLICCVFATALTIILSFKHITVKINYATMAYYTVIGALGYAGLSSIELGSAWLNMFAKCFLWIIVLVPAVLFREKELRDMVKGLCLPYLKIFRAEK